MDPAVVERLTTAANIWLATVRPPADDGVARPHLVPLWFAWMTGAGDGTGRLYLCTGGDSVKARNLQHNPYVALALEDGSHPVILEGEARRLDETPEDVRATFREKYEWDIQGDTTYNALYEVVPLKIRAW